MLADVWPNVKPSTIDFDEFVEINEFLSLFVTLIKIRIYWKLV